MFTINVLTECAVNDKRGCPHSIPIKVGYSRVTDDNKNRLRAVLQAIPKTEIHLHLEGMCSVNSLWALIEKNKTYPDGIESKADLEKRFKVKSLDEFIWIFINVIQNSFREVSDLEYMITDARDYLKRNNIVYAEIFFAPSKFIQNGLAFKDIINVLTKGAERILAEENIEIKYIIDVSRSYGVENALFNLDQTIRFKTDSVIGIGLGGAEASGPAKDFSDIFSKAQKHNLKVVAHAGEDVGPQSIWDALKKLKALRIGHGISAKEDIELMDYLRDKKIPLEICPTSNVFTQRYVSRLEDHPIRLFFDHNIYVTLNTDDPTLFGIELIEEYMNLHKFIRFSEQEIFQIIKNSIYGTFLSEERKDEIWYEAKSIIQESGYSL